MKTIQERIKEAADNGMAYERLNCAYKALGEMLNTSLFHDAAFAGLIEQARTLRRTIDAAHDALNDRYHTLSSDEE